MSNSIHPHPATTPYPRTMQAYRTCFAIAAVMVGLPIGALLLLLLLRQTLTGQPLMALLGSALALIAVTAWALHRQWRHAFACSMALAALLWLPLAWQTSQRIAFMLRHGGMDCASCEASPLAFLIGLVFEQWFFLALTAVLLTGARHIWYLRRSRPHLREDGT